MKILSKLFLALGTVLIFAAAGLLLYNRWDNTQAGEQAERILVQLEDKKPQTTGAAIPEAKTEQEETDPLAPPEEPQTPKEMTVQTIDGNDYIGYLSVPALSLDLPVLSQWSYEGLRTAPGRFSGSVYTGDLVICAHNYASHFGRLPYLEIGTPVSFTDMDGVVWNYTLSKTETLSPDSLEDMTDRFRSDSGWDMTLFTCTPGGQARVALRLRME